MLFFNFSFFNFDDFVTAFAKKVMKKPPAFMVGIKRSNKLIPSYKDLSSRNFWQWNNSPLKKF